MFGTETRVDPAPGRGVVLYDGDCSFCQRSIAILKKLDWLSRLHYQSFRETEKLPPCEVPLDFEKMVEEMHVVTPYRKRALAGFSAFRWMAWRMPLTLSIAPFLYLPGVLWLGNKAYRWVARNRFRLMPCHGAACKVPLKR